MKRFGFKFTKLDGYLSSAIDLRFWSIVAALICGVFACFIGDHKAYILIFMPFSFVYVILGFGMEFFRKTFSIVSMLVSLAFIFILLLCVYCSGIDKFKSIYAVIIFTIYHGLMFIIALGILLNKKL